MLRRLSAALSLILIFSAFSMINEKTVYSSVLQSTNEINKSEELVDQKLYNRATSASVVPYPFQINPNHGHTKIFLKNHSKKPVHITLTHVKTGKVYFSQDIEGKQDLEWYSFTDYSQGMRTGDYILEWSGRGAKVNAELYGKTASSISVFEM